jgi:hypothetical protein
MSLPMAIGPRAAVVFALRLVCGCCFFVDVWTFDVASSDLHQYRVEPVLSESGVSPTDVVS